ncbi:MAG TPA: sigma-70 family RNA polymerase sigma factor, partial [Solirubrobacteraceae bacterium]|nr:sigma-70 family RNA polymerase sigma factor [Solirubrobacteraceae bacterium]
MTRQGQGGGVVPLRGRRGRSQPTARELAHLSDEAVLALIARADEQALSELYRRFGRLAYGLAYRILRDDALAQDAVQEAFLGVWRAAGRFTAERAKPSTWLLTLVHRRAVDLVRREERRRTEPLQPDSEPTDSEAPDELELLSERQSIREALRKLPPEQREAIELAYYGGYTQSELAERLGQ